MDILAITVCDYFVFLFSLYNFWFWPRRYWKLSKVTTFVSLRASYHGDIKHSGQCFITNLIKNVLLCSSSWCLKTQLNTGSCIVLDIYNVSQTLRVKKSLLNLSAQTCGACKFYHFIYCNSAGVYSLTIDLNSYHYNIHIFAKEQARRVEKFIQHEI